MRFRSMLPVVLLLASRTVWCAFTTEALDSASAREVYGIRLLSNAASTASIKVQDSVVSLAATFASDSTEGFSANVDLEVPLCPDRRVHDLRDFKSLQFRYRNTEKITDYLSVSFGSDLDKQTTSGWIWPEFEAGIAGTNALAAGADWKAVEVVYGDFMKEFFVDPGPEYWAHFDSTFAFARSIRFSPKTSYTSSGVQLGTACTKCVGPTMTAQTLEIRDLVLFDKDSNRVELPCRAIAGVVRTPSRIRFEASYRDGVLSVERLPGYLVVEVVSASGRVVARLGANETNKAVALDRGAWFVVARGVGHAPLVRPLAVLR